MSSAAAAAAAAPLASRPRRNSAKPTPLDPSVVAASNAVEPGIKSPMTPGKKTRKDSGPPRSAPPIDSPKDEVAAAAAAAAPKTPTIPSPLTIEGGEKTKPPPLPSTSKQIPPNLTLSPTPTTPNPALRSPRPPIKSAHFDALEAEGERDAMVRTLVFQLQKEMQDEIDRLTANHRRVLEEKNLEFQALAELLSKKREDWALQMAANRTLIADQQEDIVGLVKQNNEATTRVRKLERELDAERDESERLRQTIADYSQPCSSSSFIKPKDPPPRNDKEEFKKTSNKDSDGFEKPIFNFRRAVKRSAPDS